VQIADYLNRVRQPFNVNSLALKAAEVALDDESHLLASRRINDDGMAYLEQACRQRGLEFIPSAGNFLAIDLARPADALYRAMMQHGVIVRPVANYEMPNFLRVTIGTEDENRRFVEVLDTVLRDV
jgi:histidinol-phosphate aminotransferase